jgi:hypothetical protein
MPTLQEGAQQPEPQMPTMQADPLPPPTQPRDVETASAPMTGTWQNMHYTTMCLDDQEEDVNSNPANLQLICPALFGPS